MIKAYWYYKNAWANKGNFGDILSPEIIKFLTNEQPVNYKTGGERLLSIGSIIELINDGDIVWGSGLIKNMPLIKKNNVKFCCVRGQLTRYHLLKAGYTDVPEIYADPSILVPYLYDIPEVEPIYDIGIIPHYVDMPLMGSVLKEVRSQVHIIDIMSGIQNVINEVNKCKCILSSCLHGLILAESLKIPACYIKFSVNVIGGDFKFIDYYSGTGRKLYKIECNEPLSSIKLHLSKEYIEQIPNPEFDIKNLLLSFPFKNEYFEKMENKIFQSL